MTLPTEIYYNADFDLSLRPRPLSLETQRVQKRVKGLTLQGIVGASSNDSVIIKTGSPEAFLGYLRERGLETPCIVPHPESRGDSTLLPLGWNAEAIAMDQDRLHPSPRPPLDTIRRVNSRLFAQEIQLDLFGPHDAGVAIRSLDEAEDHLERDRGQGKGWVAKANHGNAGMANRRLKRGRPNASDRRFLETLLREDDWVILEPWQDRVLDLCTVFEVAGDGTVEALSIHQVVNTADGGFIGDLFHPNLSFAEPWVDGLVEAAEVVALKLHVEGYFGPLAMDSFVLLDGNRRQLRPIVDLNCRRPASFAASRWLSRLVGRPHMLWRFLNRRRFDLPHDYGDWVRAVGDRGFSTSTERGVLLTSPLSIRHDGKTTPSPKVGVAIVGDTRDDVAGHESWLRDRFER